MNNNLTSRSNSSSVWICFSVSMVSSSFDNSRTAPNCFLASSALDNEPSIVEFMILTPQGYITGRLFTYCVKQKEGRPSALCATRLLLEWPAQHWAASPQASPRHMLKHILCCHTIAFVNSLPSFAPCFLFLYDTFWICVCNFGLNTCFAQPECKTIGFRRLPGNCFVPFQHEFPARFEIRTNFSNIDFFCLCIWITGGCISSVFYQISQAKVTLILITPKKKVVKDVTYPIIKGWKTDFHLLGVLAVVAVLSFRTL